MRKTYGCMQFTYTVVESQHRMLFHATIIANMVMPVITVSICQLVSLLVIGNEHPALSCCRYFEEVERKTAGSTEQPYRLAFV